MVTQPSKQLTLDQAYQAAYLWLDHTGDPPVEISEPAHGSVELITERAFVRVRSSDTPVEQSSVLALLRAAESGKRLVIFSPSGFSPGAKSIAETQGIALYTLDPTGRAVPETTHARSLAPDPEPDPPFAPSREPEEDFWTDLKNRSSEDEGEPDEDEDPGIQAATTDWADCPNCGATHYRNARFCRDCGTNLMEASTPPAAPPAVAPSTSPPPAQPAEEQRSTTGSRLRCRNCGSHDIELIE